MPKLNQSQKQELLELYKTQQMDSRQLSKKFNITLSSVIGYLKRNGIERKRFNYSKKYNNTIINHDFFSDINSEKAAYYAGFIAADGSIYKHPYKNMQKRLTIEIHKKDIEILEKFDVGTDIFERKNRDMVSKAISSDRICDDLEKCGIIQNKTFKLQFPKNINDEHIHHFIRGVFDGDGWFTVGKTGYIRAGFVGCYEFLEQIQKRIPCKSSLRKPKGKKYGILSIYHTETLKLAPYLYKEATIFLQRKRNIVAEFLFKS